MFRPIWKHFGVRITSSEYNYKNILLCGSLGVEEAEEVSEGERIPEKIDI